MNLANQLRLLSGGFVLALAAAGVTGWIIIGRLSHTALDAVQVRLPSVRSQMDMDMMHDGLRAVAYSAVIAAGAKDEPMLKTSQEELAEFSKQFTDSLDELAKLPLDDAVRSNLSSLRPKLDAYLADVTAVVRTAAAGKTDEAIAKLSALQRSFKELETENEQLGDLIEQGARQASETAARQGGSSFAIFSTILALGALGGLASSFIISRRIVRRTGALITGIERMAGGDLRSRVGLDGGDEFTRVGGSIDHLAGSLSTMLGQVHAGADSMRGSADGLTSLSDRLSMEAERTARQAGGIAAATRDVGSSAQSVAAGMEEMAASVAEIATSAQQASDIAAGAVTLSQTASTGMQRLGGASDEISQVVQMISAIAAQTNLLALNATIEAARAGDAGRGFAVVANEVKELARQTAKATGEIGSKIGAMQGEVGSAISTIAEISQVIGRINDIQSTIASAVQEQAATTSEITRSINEAAKGVTAISETSNGIATAADGTAAAARQVKEAAAGLAGGAEGLRRAISGFSA